MPSQKDRPVLVLVDTKTFLCKRYTGKTLHLKVQATQELSAEDVELIRATPEAIFPEEHEPESA